VYSALPIFRHPGDTFKLRVYDTKNAVVAEFDVPHTTSATLPVWKPERLPATKKADDLDVTLERFLVQPFDSHEGARNVTRHSITPVVSIAHNGQPAPNLGAQEFVFEDVFGNTSGQWNTRLNLHEPAWKLKIKLWPGDKATPDPSHERSVAGVSLAAAKAANLIRQKLTIEGVTVEFIAVGGAEKVIYTDSSAAGNGSSSSGGSFDGSTFQVENRSSAGVLTTTVDNKWPHLLLRCTGLDPDHRLVVRVRDDQGGDVPVQQAPVSDQIVVFMKPAEGTKTVDPTFAVQQAKNVEFLVEPPAIPSKPQDSLSQ
jgi:hypothetical protein